MRERPAPDAILHVLSDILCRLCELERLDLSPDLPLADIPGIDSLRILQATALLEEHFGVEIDVVALEDLHCVRDVVATISNARPEA